MIYTTTYEVRWHETDANREVSPSHLQMYMQETANRQMRAYDFDLDRVRDEMGLGFLLSRMTARIYLPLHAHDKIEVQTWVMAPHGLSFDRCFRILREGETVAEAYSAWGLMNLREKRLVRGEEFEYPYPPDEKIIPRGVPVRFRTPPAEQMEEVGVRRIGYADIDYNGHMNNTRYPDMLCDFTPDVTKKRVVGLSLSYLHEAAYGKELRILRAPFEETDRDTGERREGWFFRTLDADGVTCLEALMLTVPRGPED